MNEISYGRFRDNRWTWKKAPDTRVCGPNLYELTPKDIRLLGKSATQLYMHLERCRGWEQQEVPINLGNIAKFLGMSYRTAKRALNRLREIGVVSSRFVCTGHPAEKDPFASAWHRSLKLTIWGSWEVRKGKLKIVFPGPLWREWAKNRRPHGRPRISNLQNKLAPSNQNKVGPYHESSPPLSRDLSKKDGPLYKYINTNTTYQVFVSNDTKNSGTPHPGFFEVEKPKMKLEDIDTLAPRPELKPRAEPFSVPPRTPVRRIQAEGRVNLETIFGEEMDQLNRVDLLVSCYRRAIKLLYGTEPKYMHRSGLHISTVRALKKKGVPHPNISHHKHYGRLSAAVDMLVKHGLQPAWWAEWYAGKLKEWGNAGKGAWGSKVPPIEIIFNAKTIEKRRGWFRNDYDAPASYKLDITDVNIEQELRIQEIHLLNRGFDTRSALEVLPKWYTKKRISEIAAGHEDPNDFYPI